MTYVLGTGMLLEVMVALLRHDLLSVRRKALELLAAKLQALDNKQLTSQEVLTDVCIYKLLLIAKPITSRDP